MDDSETDEIVVVDVSEVHIELFVVVVDDEPEQDETETHHQLLTMVEMDDYDFVDMVVDEDEHPIGQVLVSVIDDNDVVDDEMVLQGQVIHRLIHDVQPQLVVVVDEDDEVVVVEHEQHE